MLVEVRAELIKQGICLFVAEVNYPIELSLVYLVLLVLSYLSNWVKKLISNNISLSTKRLIPIFKDG